MPERVANQVQRLARERVAILERVAPDRERVRMIVRQVMASAFGVA